MLSKVYMCSRGGGGGIPGPMPFLGVTISVPVPFLGISLVPCPSGAQDGWPHNSTYQIQRQFLNEMFTFPI